MVTVSLIRQAYIRAVRLSKLGPAGIARFGDLTSYAPAIQKLAAS